MKGGDQRSPLLFDVFCGTRLALVRAKQYRCPKLEKGRVVWNALPAKGQLKAK